MRFLANLPEEMTWNCTPGRGESNGSLNFKEERQLKDKTTFKKTFLPENCKCLRWRSHVCDSPWHPFESWRRHWGKKVWHLSRLGVCTKTHCKVANQRSQTSLRLATNATSGWSALPIFCHVPQRGVKYRWRGKRKVEKGWLGWRRKNSRDRSLCCVLLGGRLAAHLTGWQMAGALQQNLTGCSVSVMVGLLRNWSRVHYPDSP